MTAISAADLRELIAATKARNAYGGTTVLPGLTVIAMAELALQAQEMQEALRPFAEVAERIAAEHPGWDHDEFQLLIAGSAPLKLGPYRRAAALSPQPREDVTNG